MVYRIADGASFKQSNLQNWRANTDFWLRGKMRHLRDVYDSTKRILADVLGRRREAGCPRVLDVGCGEGWLLRLIEEQNFEVEYVGLDFNERFIDALARQHSGNEHVRFILHDVEEGLPKDLVGTVDVVINAFNFFEVPRLSIAFRNVAEALRDDGVLIIVTIDPVIQLVAISNSFQELKEALREYQNHPEELGYDKEIDASNGESERVYKGILYSTATYVDLAKQNGLQLIDYQEVVATANRIPQIYQYIIFGK
jgi:SAM-dependent methyltransferase